MISDSGLLFGPPCIYILHCEVQRVWTPECTLTLTHDNALLTRRFHQ